MTDRLQPGEFRATCNLAKPHPISLMAAYERREAEERGWKKGFREARVKGDTRRTECYLEPLCDGFETTDKSAFVEHMATVHGRTLTGWSCSKGANADLVNRASGTWRTPRPGREGAPLKKAITEATVTCEGCGLVMENGTTLASERYVREHLELCVSRVGAA
jgi:hypothetical protein